MRLLSRAVLVGLLVLLVTVTGRAAGVLVQGTVVDPAGLPIPGATVELIGGGKTIAKTVTAADGGFKFAAVAAGSYDINISLAGFRQTRSTLVVGASVPGPLRYTLQVGSMSEIVTVTSADRGIPGGVVGEVVGGLPSAPAPPPAAAPQAVTGFAGGRGGGYGGGALQMYVPAPPPGETYGAIDENTFRRVTDQPLSTFSIDVDTASLRQRPPLPQRRTRCRPPDAVRIEELVNYFPYDYADPTQATRRSRVTTEVAPCPWNADTSAGADRPAGASAIAAGKTAAAQPGVPDRRLGLDGAGRTSCRWSSGAAACWSRQLGENDRVAIVVYAGASGLVAAARRAAIATSRDPGRDSTQLQAGGSTNGGAGIQLAYAGRGRELHQGRHQPRHPRHRRRLQRRRHQPGRAHAPDRGEAQERRVPDRARLRHGQPQGRDAGEARRQGQRQLRLHRHARRRRARCWSSETGATLVTIAKDVKIQVEFNPAKVGAYRLIGYENRMLANEDFNDDTKDAGEIGAGHTVTALYEIVPAGEDVDAPGVDPLKYQKPAAPPVAMTTIPSRADDGEGPLQGAGRRHQHARHRAGSRAQQCRAEARRLRRRGRRVRHAAARLALQGGRVVDGRRRPRENESGRGSGRLPRGVRAADGAGGLARPSANHCREHLAAVI